MGDIFGKYLARLFLGKFLGFPLQIWKIQRIVLSMRFFMKIMILIRPTPKNTQIVPLGYLLQHLKNRKIYMSMMILTMIMKIVLQVQYRLSPMMKTQKNW